MKGGCAKGVVVPCSCGWEFFFGKGAQGAKMHVLIFRGRVCLGNFEDVLVRCVEETICWFGYDLVVIGGRICDGFFLGRKWGGKGFC